MSIENAYLSYGSKEAPVVKVEVFLNLAWPLIVQAFNVWLKMY